MNESLKVIERMVAFLYSELNNAANVPSIDEKAYVLLKEAAVDCINLQDKISTARGWINTKD